MNILDICTSSNCILLNMNIARELNNDTAIVLGELVFEFKQNEKFGTLTHDKYFPCTIENLENRANVKTKKQKEILTKLEKLNLIKVELRGIPAKRFISVLTENIGMFVDELKGRY